MDKFDGIDPDEMHSQLVIKNYKSVYLKKYIYCHVVIERVKQNEKIEGRNYTFTDLKRKEVSTLNIAFYEQLSDEIIDKYINTNKIFYFKKPILLRAQNSKNRTGYGQIWDWSIDRYSPIDEGTKYGETTNYKIVGIYLIT